jgi:hypothetical protein
MSNYRVVSCEASAGETDDGECLVCEGTRLAVIETQEIEMSDLDAMEPCPSPRKGRPIASTRAGDGESRIQKRKRPFPSPALRERRHRSLAQERNRCGERRAGGEFWGLA